MTRINLKLQDFVIVSSEVAQIQTSRNILPCKYFTQN